MGSTPDESCAGFVFVQSKLSEFDAAQSACSATISNLPTVGLDVHQGVGGANRHICPCHNRGRLLWAYGATLGRKPGVKTRILWAHGVL